MNRPDLGSRNVLRRDAVTSRPFGPYAPPSKGRAARETARLRIVEAVTVARKLRRVIIAALPPWRLPREVRERLVRVRHAVRLLAGVHRLAFLAEGGHQLV